MKRLTECYKLYRELPIFQVSISSSGGPNVDPPRCPGAVPEPGGAGGVWPDPPGAAPRHHPPVRPRPLQPRPVEMPGRGVLLWPGENIQVTKKTTLIIIYIRIFNSSLLGFYRTCSGGCSPTLHSTRSLSKDPRAEGE